MCSASHQHGDIPAGAGLRWLVSATIALSALAFLAWSVAKADAPKNQWDFETYYYAVQLVDAGGDPYNHQELSEFAGRPLHRFAYPRHTLAFFRLFAADDLESAKRAYLCAKVVCVILLFAVWTGLLVRAGARLWFIAFAAVGFDAAISIDLIAGNVSVFEQLLIWTGVLALLRSRVFLYCAMILLAAQFKILPVALLVLVLLSDAPRKRDAFAGSILTIMFLGAILYLRTPDAFVSFFDRATTLSRSEYGRINPCAPAIIHEAVNQLSPTLSNLGLIGPRRAVPWIYGLWVLAVAIATARRVLPAGDLRARLFLLILAYALIAPRMKDYSYILLLVPTFELIRARLSRPISGRWWLIAIVVVATLPGTDVLWRYRLLMLSLLAWWFGLQNLKYSRSQQLRVDES